MDVRQYVSVRSGCELYGGTNHGRAEVYPDDRRGASLQKHSAKAAFTAAAIEDGKTTNIAASFKHRLIEQAGAS